jgi:hypothetical protein
MRIRARMARLVGIAVICAGTLVFAAPGVATAASTCYGTGCDGLDPQGMGCAYNGAYLNGYFNYVYTERSKSFADGARVDLRYSTACNAVWGRVTGGTATTTYIVFVERFSPYQDYSSHWVTLHQGWQTWTPMVGHVSSADAFAERGVYPNVVRGATDTW